METTLEAAAPLLPRQRGVIEIVDHTFWVYRTKFATFFALTMIVIAPLSVTGLVLTGEADRTGFSPGFNIGAVVLLNLIQLFLQFVLISGLITVITSEHILGREMPISAAFGLAWRRFWVLTGTLMLFVFLVTVTSIPVSLLGAICIFPLLLLIPIYYVSTCIIMYIVPVIMLEKSGSLYGLRRALVLGKTKFWRNIGFAFAVFAIILFISLAFAGLAGLVVDTTDSDPRISVLMQTLVQVFIVPIFPIGQTLMYYDMRMRIEGLDIQFESLQTPVQRPSDLRTYDIYEPFLSGKDVMNMIVAVGGLFVISCGLITLPILLISATT